MVKTTVKELKNEQNHVTFAMDLISKEQNFIVEGKNGMYLNIRLKQDHNLEDVRLQYYQKTKTHYIFFLQLVNEKEKLNRKHNWFALRKTIAEIEEMGVDNNQALVEKTSRISVFLDNDLDGENEKDICEKFTEEMTFFDLIELQKMRQESHLHLTFQICQDSRNAIDFVPFIFQDRKSIETNSFCIFDIRSMSVVKTECILPAMHLRKYIRQSESGFVNYYLTRTSNCYDQKFGFFTVHQCRPDNNFQPSHQITKFQIAAQYYLPQEGDEEENFNYSEKPGMSTIELNDYLVDFHCCGFNKVKLVGRKQILLSEAFQKNRNLSFDKVFILPHFDKNGHIKGS